MDAAVKLVGYGKPLVTAVLAMRQRSNRPTIDTIDRLRDELRHSVVPCSCRDERALVFVSQGAGMFN